jgi:hypothetical protein
MENATTCTSFGFWICIDYNHCKVCKHCCKGSYHKTWSSSQIISNPIIELTRNHFLFLNKVLYLQYQCLALLFTCKYQWLLSIQNIIYHVYWKLTSMTIWMSWLWFINVLVGLVQYLCSPYLNFENMIKFNNAYVQCQCYRIPNVVPMSKDYIFVNIFVL